MYYNVDFSTAQNSRISPSSQMLYSYLINTCADFRIRKNYVFMVEYFCVNGMSKCLDFNRVDSFMNMKAIASGLAEIIKSSLNHLEGPRGPK